MEFVSPFGLIEAEGVWLLLILFSGDSRRPVYFPRLSLREGVIGGEIMCHSIHISLLGILFSSLLGAPASLKILYLYHL